MPPCMKGNHAAGASAGEGACYAPLLGAHKGSSQALGPFWGTPTLHSCCQTGESPGKGHYNIEGLEDLSYEEMWMDFTSSGWKKATGEAEHLPAYCLYVTEGYRGKLSQARPRSAKWKDKKHWAQAATQETLTRHQNNKFFTARLVRHRSRVTRKWCFLRLWRFSELD